MQGRLRSYVGWRCDPLRVQRHLCGVERMSAAAAIRTAQADQLGDQIIAAGFAPNGFVLDINEALDVPRDFPLSAPWNLPSRLFQFPRSEEHTSELQSLLSISLAVTCLKQQIATNI